VAEEDVAPVAVAEDVVAAATRPVPYPSIQLEFSLDGTLDRVPSGFGIAAVAGAVGQTIDNPESSGPQVCYSPQLT
jgi:hypothetical protein